MFLRFIQHTNRTKIESMPKARLFMSFMFNMFWKKKAIITFMEVATKKIR